jgi:DeoR family suf operon transcriptional repressor
MELTMQQTRQHILEILREKGQITVDQLVNELCNRIGEITAVTVRYHLDILRGEGLVETPGVRRRGRPGRPQYVYSLTEQAHSHFPKNYQALASHLLDEIKSRFTASEVNVVIEGVARRMADEAGHIPSNIPSQDRLERTVDYLCQRGYQASWEPADGKNGAYLLHISNCPYHQVSSQHHELCFMDAKLITILLGTAPRSTSNMSKGQDTCTYEAHLPIAAFSL